ncbi:c-type cytochrome [Terasakiella pusilla]|jgi:cytochrome c5|uniref:c-type cytochrome n=1 Tax=Terasakiella pusilla TaxID=64973 RepID=UPI003AA88A76
MRSFLILITAITLLPISVPAQDFDTNTTYAEYCAACHGFDGSGMSADIPDFTDESNRLRKSDNALIKIIMEGVQQADGTIVMPAFGGAEPFSYEQSQQLLDFLRESFGS